MSDWLDPMIRQFRATGGTVDRFGRNLVVMHAIGAKSGAPRVTAARGIEHDGGWVVAATAGGQPADPAWAHNLRAHPDIDIEVPLPGTGTETVRVHATELSVPQRAAAWQRFLDASPNFAVFATRTDRVFPIFHFTPRRNL